MISKTYKTKKTIAAALLDIEPGTPVTVVYAPITEKVWLRDCDPICLADAFGDGIDPDFLADIVIGHSVDLIVNRRLMDNRVILEDEVGHDITVTADHLKTLTVLPGPVRFRPEGMTQDVVINPDGSIKSGCQTITKAGAIDIYKRLGEVLGRKD